ncbi:MAG: ATP-dependent DNA helicase [Desulfobacteraceae bacterium]|nr:ATP-dependent DNA helicase [Desulfobacteraceae bacterium]
MFEPFSENLEDLLFCSGHSCRGEDGSEQLFAIAVLRLSPGGGRKHFASLIRTEPLSARNRARSGVTNKQLAKAPSPETVCNRVQAFIGSPSFIFLLDERNASGAFQRIIGKVRTVDLVFAAEFFLPFLESHTPEKLSEYIHERPRNTIGFSAREMADLSADLLQHICGVQLNDRLRPWAPALRWYLRRSRTLFGETLTAAARSYARYFGDLFTPCEAADTDSWRPYLEAARYDSDPSGQELPLQPVSVSGMPHYFNGMASALSGYRYRGEQVLYAENVVRAFNEGEVLTIEAGTGTGKTQGYLLPLFVFLRQNPSARAVISTYTKSLQEQIIGNEVSRTVSAFDHFRGTGVSLLKGKSSYVCAEKLDQVFEEESSGKRLLAWVYALVLVFHFRQADLDRVGRRVRHWLGTAGGLSRLLEEISAKSGCPPRHSRCPAQVVVADALRSRIVVTNHHKLAVLDQDPVLSGRFSLYVIDEANHFEKAARNALGIEVRSAEVLALSSFLAEAAADLQEASGRLTAGEVEALAASTRLLHHHCEEIGQLLRTMTPAVRPGELGVLPADQPLLLGAMERRLLGIHRALADLCLSFRWSAEETGSDRAGARRRRRAAAARTRLTELAESAGILANLLQGDDLVRSFRYHKKDWALSFLPVDVSEAVRERLCETAHSVVFTSATLSRSGEFDCFRESLGLDSGCEDGQNEAASKNYRFVVLPPPAFQKAVEIVIPERAVSGRFSNKKAWLRSVSEMLPELIEEHNGRTLVLFASYEDLRTVYREVRGAIDTLALPLLVQQQGSPTASLCEEFRSVKESVLFGVDSFWHGVDFRGDTLTQVVITRIPFPSPYDALQQTRRRILPEEDYWRRYRYETEIKLRQGIGRLIRSEEDFGRVVVLDRRFSPERFGARSV